jgi:hypothetical protein
MNIELQLTRMYHRIRLRDKRLSERIAHLIDLYVEYPLLSKHDRSELITEIDLALFRSEKVLTRGF